jgi:serine/threonine-protein kinase
MSPEQLEGARSVDHRTDLWALGVLAYHMFVGRPPFRGESLAQVALAVFQGDYVAPTIARTDLPVGIDAWFEKACAQKPEDRFASARELADAFADALATPRGSADTRVMPIVMSPNVTGPPEPPPSFPPPEMARRASAPPPPTAVPSARASAPPPRPPAEAPATIAASPRALAATPAARAKRPVMGLMMTTPLAQTAPGAEAGFSKRRGLVILVASAAVTLLLVGAGFGLRSSPEKPEKPETVETEPGITTVVATAPPAPVVTATALATAPAPVVIPTATAPATAAATAIATADPTPQPATPPPAPTDSEAAPSIASATAPASSNPFKRSFRQRRGGRIGPGPRNEDDDVGF